MALALAVQAISLRQNAAITLTAPQAVTHKPTILLLMLSIIIHIRVQIIFHENFTQKTRSTESIYFLQGNSTAAAGIQKSGFSRHEFPEK
jgi:hypothetical protein